VNDDRRLSSVDDVERRKRVRAALTGAVDLSVVLRALGGLLSHRTMRKLTANEQRQRANEKTASSPSPPPRQHLLLLYS
jgi:hypothetical protein